MTARCPAAAATSHSPTALGHDVLRAAIGVLYNITSVGSNPFFPEMGVRPDQLSAILGSPAAGRLLTGAPNEIVLGQGAAQALETSVGKTITLGTTRMRVVGIFRSSSTFENGGGYLPLETVQQIASKPGTVTAVYVTVARGAHPTAVAAVG